MVAGAAADIALKPFANFRLARVGIVFNEIQGTHDHTRVQKPHCRPWFSRKASCIGCNVSPSARPSIVVLQRRRIVRQNRAALEGLSILVNDARTALATAADMGTGQTQMFA